MFMIVLVALIILPLLLLRGAWFKTYTYALGALLLVVLSIDYYQRSSFADVSGRSPEPIGDPLVLLIAFGYVLGLVFRVMIFAISRLVQFLRSI